MLFAMLKDDLGSGDPVGEVGIDEMRYDFARGHGVFALVRERPRVGQVAKECIERGWGAGEKSDREFEILFHGVSDSMRERVQLHPQRRRPNARHCYKRHGALEMTIRSFCNLSDFHEREIHRFLAHC